MKDESKLLMDAEAMKLLESIFRIGDLIFFLKSPDTQRRLFAAMAMQGLCGNFEWMRQADKALENAKNDRSLVMTVAAKWAVISADALLAELAKPTETKT